MLDFTQQTFWSRMGKMKGRSKNGERRQMRGFSLWPKFYSCFSYSLFDSPHFSQNLFPPTYPFIMLLNNLFLPPQLVSPLQVIFLPQPLPAPISPCPTSSLQLSPQIFLPFPPTFLLLFPQIPPPPPQKTFSLSTSPPNFSSPRSLLQFTLELSPKLPSKFQHRLPPLPAQPYSNFSPINFSLNLSKLVKTH